MLFTRAVVLIRAVIVWTSIILLVSCDGGVGGSGDDSSDGSSLLGLRNKISITGAIKATGGAVSADNPLGLQGAANKAVSLFRIDNQGHVVGDALDTSMSDLDGHYILVLPDYVGISSDLIVETRLENNRPVRAIVIDENTDISPITEYITAKIIADPNLDLSTLPATEVVDLIKFVESLPLTPTSDLADLLTEIAQVADTVVDAEVGGLAVDFNPRVRLSGLLSIPSGELKNGAYALRNVVAPGITISLYEVNKYGETVGGRKDFTTTGPDGRYDLELTDGLGLSITLIIRAEVKSGTVLNALVSSKQLDINTNSNSIFNKLADTGTLTVYSTGIVRELTTLANNSNIPEASTIAEANSAFDSSFGAEFDSRIDDFQASIAASPGIWGVSSWNSRWGVSSYQ
ncbi:MAG: hypothetical protein ACERLB_15890 [Gammaproteobacteria bacterium]